MKKIITRVGTSLFENYLKEHDNSNFKDPYVYFKENKIRADDLDQREKIRRNNIEKVLNEKYFKNNINASAEIKSLIKLAEELEEEFEIYLLYSDTALSRLAAEILERAIFYYDELKKCKVFIKKVEGLQSWNRGEFEKGMRNLINTIGRIAEEYWENIIINITGGYKAAIPCLTILAQVNRYPIYYIFEETDTLITISYIPISINYSIFEKHEKFFRKLEREGTSELSQGLSDEEMRDISSLLDLADNLYSLNPLGIILWEKYKKIFEMVYVSVLVQEYINQDNKYKTIFEKSAIALKKRYSSNPAHPDLNHIIKGFKEREGFKCFKHTEENLQVRILYKVEEWTTRYNTTEFDIYIGNIKIGSDVHNVESEYVKSFEMELGKIKNLDDYKIYKIRKEVQND